MMLWLNKAVGSGCEIGRLDGAVFGVSSGDLRAYLSQEAVARVSGTRIQQQGMQMQYEMVNLHRMLTR